MEVYELPLDVFMKFRTYIEITQAKEAEHYHALEMERNTQAN